MRPPRKTSAPSPISSIMLDELRAAIDSERVRITRHARIEADEDRINLAEIYETVRHGRIIESYPTDHPFPSALVFGRNGEGEPIHTVWAFDDATKVAVLVTVYRPDPKNWIDFTVRRK